MPASAEQLLHAVQTIETQLTLIKQSLSELGIHEEGLVGTFDGESILLENGRKQVIPPNYASKSMLIPGDTLRMTEDPTGVEQPRFKQISKVERTKATGLLTRKDGKFEVICEQGSFKVLAVAIKHFEGEPGDQVIIQFAKSHLKGSWAAVEKVIKTSNQASSAATPTGNGTASTIANPIASAIQPSSISHQVPVVEPIAAQPTVEVALEAPIETSAQMPADTQGETLIEVPETPALAPQPAPASPAVAAPQPATAADRTNRSVGRSSTSNSSSSAASKPSTNKPKSRDAGRSYAAPRATAPRPASPPMAPARPATQPVAPIVQAQSLPASQGEIVIPNVMDDDELA
jgi:hypothetical protein